MATHATTKFKWLYMHEDGSTTEGAVIVPIGEEPLAVTHIERVASESLKNGESFNKGNLAITEIGDAGKLR